MNRIEKFWKSCSENQQLAIVIIAFALLMYTKYGVINFN